MMSKSSHVLYSLCLLVLSLARSRANIITLFGQDIFVSEVELDGFVDTAACYADLEAADIDGDRRISSEEYADFIFFMEPSLDFETFRQLPFIIQNTFTFLACLCEEFPGNEDGNSCCQGVNAGIETGGAFEGETPTEDQEVYLYTVCLFSQNAITRVLSSDPPTSSPSAAPSPSPSDAPSPSPTQPIRLEATVEYLIGVRGSMIPEDSYVGTLTSAMDSLAPQVLAEVSRRGLGELPVWEQQNQRRHLSTVTVPTSIESITTVDCNGREQNADDICRTVEATITMIFQPNEAEPAVVVEDFESDLDDAIENDELGDAIENIDVAAPVYVITSSGFGTARTDDGPALSPGGVAGIVVVSLAGLLLVLALLLTRRQPAKDDPDELPPAPENLDLEEEEPATVDKRSAVLGAPDPYYGKPVDKMVDNDEEPPLKDDSSSNAGSSGWSSSAGVSSLNTGSADGLDESQPVGKTLAALSAQSRPPLDPSAEENQAVSRADLDSAIEAGDWAAVGATAALLAAASDSQSFTSQSESKSGQHSAARSRSGSSVSSVDAARAAELDHLVDAGDWEGVVLAAARYEQAEGKGSVASGSESRSNTQTLDSSVASSSSKATKRQEMRAIVEDLVRRVVPEEIQNVDEMMLQFRGREEELIETLRTMQERQIAQKARQGAQKAAKQQAKMSASSRLLASSTPDQGQAPTKSLQKEGGAPAGGVSSRSLGTGHILSQSASSKSLGTGKVEPPPKTQTEEPAKPPKKDRAKKQSALERAIEAGDWEAVGEAAAMLSDHSMVSSADSDEINRLADGYSSAGTSDVASAGYLSEAGEELDELIDKGDWTGVVEAASAMGEKDKGTSAKAKEAKQKKQEQDEAKRQRRLKHLQEEQEALAQAEIWMAIAEQNRKESDEKQGTAQAASDAADWAIARSLNALVEAEQGGALKDSIRTTRSTSSKSFRKANDSSDDEELEV